MVCFLSAERHRVEEESTSGSVHSQGVGGTEKGTGPSLLKARCAEVTVSPLQKTQGGV